MTPRHFQYTPPGAFPGMRIGLPFLPITLVHHSCAISALALVDSGSTVSVLPYDVGLRLGLKWDEQTVPTPLVGSLKHAPAWGVQVIGEVSPFSPVVLKFAWTQVTSERVPLILGQTNFFQAFDVCFSGSQQIFEIAAKGALIRTT